MLSVDIAGATRPRPDQAVGGDYTFIRQHEGIVWVLCMDVLGHGPAAYSVVGQVDAYMDELQQFDPMALLNTLNERLKGGRGAAISICLIDLNQGSMDFVGVGNVQARKLSPVSQTLVNQDGVVGEKLNNAQLRQYPIAAGEIYLLHTDGIQSRFNISQYRQIHSDSAIRASNHILKHFAKDHDDAGCIVIKVAT